MTISVKHAKVVAVSDSSDGKVSSNAWNDAHTLQCASGVVLGRQSSGIGEVEEIPVSAISSSSVATRSALSLLPTSKVYAYLTESGREGVFVWSSANLSTQVSADTQQGIYVAPSSDTTGASGAWVRKFVGPVYITWFGIKEGNASGANGAANFSAWSAMYATLLTRIPSSVSNSTYQPMEPIFAPMGWYEFNNTLDFTNATGKLLGTTTGGSSIYGTIFKFPAGVTGIRTQRYNSSGVSTVDSPTHRGGDGWIFDGIGVIGSYSTTEAEAHGFHLKSQAIIRNFYIGAFEGDGIYSNTNTSDSLADSCHIAYGRIVTCRNAIYTHGGDTNVWTVIGVSAAQNRQWAAWESSFLGNTYIGIHTDSNGITSYNDGVTIGASVVSYSGNRYYAVAGQETWCSTNAPSGTSASNQGWIYAGAGAAQSGIPAWTSGILVRAGGPFHSDNANARNLFLACYEEGGQGESQLLSPTLSIGSGPGEAMINGLYAGGFGPATKGAFTKVGTNLTVRLGENNDYCSFYHSHSTYAPNAFRLNQGHSQGTFDVSNLWFNYNNGSDVFRITGPSTTEQFGTGANQSFYFHPTHFALGAYGSARIMTYGSAAPTANAHAQGERVFALAPTLTAPIGWVATATGTPGTWAANYINARADPSTGVGYVTGAGGAVTQATSRTTGVTLNKVCGQITLVSAAGSATWQTFTVTNSTVAATDVIRVVQASGTDLYQIMVTKVAAGSFNISFATTGGTTTEQPVFNYAVIKAVAA